MNKIKTIASLFLFANMSLAMLAHDVVVDEKGQNGGNEQKEAEANLPAKAPPLEVIHPVVGTTSSAEGGELKLTLTTKHLNLN